ncbi:uncharacterized protein [Pyrus communis]|uniref:uncharacterized protein n=1 Tax=Pyrus communis TaxID=23211 RepID=UPI0035BF67F7
MENLAKLDFVTLNITGKNYLTWVMDAKIHLEAGNLGETIKEDNSASSQDQANAMIFIHRHLDEGLKSEYLMVEDPLTLWKALKNRCNHQKTLKLCGETITEEDMLEKTFSTFHASKVLMQQQYREKGFTEYNQLIYVLLMAEQNNEFLMKNHQSQLTGSAPFLEVNAASLKGNTTSSRGNNYKRRHGHKRGRWNGKGKNHGVQVPRHNIGSSFKNAYRQKGIAHMNTPRNPEVVCHRCGGNGHWARTCRTAKHMVDLYQTSLKENGVETNFLDQAKPINIPDPVSDLLGQLNTTHLDVSDFIIERGNEVYGSD